MPNMSLKKNEMPSQAPDVRNKNFEEVFQPLQFIAAAEKIKQKL